MKFQVIENFIITLPRPIVRLMNWSVGKVKENFLETIDHS